MGIIINALAFYDLHFCIRLSYFMQDLPTYAFLKFPEVKALSGAPMFTDEKRAEKGVNGRG